MADAQANININLDASQALAQLRALQAEISTFQQKMLKLNASTAASAANVQRNLLNTINATGKFSAGMTTVASSTETFTNSLEKNKFSMGEYFRYAGGASKTFGKLFTNEFNTIEKVARERVKTLQTQYIKLGREANGAMKAISVRPLALDMDNLATKTMIAAQKQQILNQLIKQGSTNLLNWGKNTQWAGRQLMVGFTIPLTIFGSLAAKTFMELEEQAIRFKRVYGELFTTQEETDKMLDQLKVLGSEFTKYGVALKDTMAMAADAAAMGKTGADLLAQVAQASRLAVLGGVEQQQALETTISLTNAFGVATEDLTKKIDFLNAVENQTVVSIEDLTIAIPKAGPVVKQLGGDVEDLAFFLTAMKEGGINASEGANALKSGLAALINPSAKASEFLSGLGINIKSIVEGNAGDIKGTVVQFAQALDTLDPLNRARAIEQLFGKFQFSRLSTLFQNVVAEGTQASRVLGLTAASTEELAILSERELKRIESSPLFKFKKAFEDLQTAMAPVGEQFLKAVTPIIEFGTKLLEKFNSMSDGGKQFVTILVAGLGVVAPTLLMIVGLVGNGVANIAKFMLFLKGMGKGGAGIQQLGMQTEYMTQQQLEANAAASALSQAHSRLQQTFTSETAAVKALAAAYREAAIASRAIMGVPTARGGGARGASKPTGFANGVLSVPGPKGAGDVVPAMLSPGEAVIPAKQANKYAGFISSIMQDKVPGFFRGIFLGMPKTFSRVAKDREASDLIASRFVKNTKVPLVKYGHQIEPTTGRSFPIPGVGGVYAKADGSKVFVKPFIDEKTAIAEMRASEIARNAHGLLAPKHTLVRIPDPTDLSGNRTIYALESKLDPMFANPTGRFTQGEMIKQLLASLVRADKDLSPGNMFGKVLTDPGPAGVFTRASGVRDMAKPGTLPSLEQQATINLLGVKGGARKFFAQATSDIARNMTPKQYQDMMIKEIDTVLPKLKQTIAGFNLKGAEKAIYDDMIKRLEAGRNVDWTRFHKMHSDVPALPPRPLELAEGIFSVPGPKGAGDVVPAMLSPGEAVIPAKQSQKYSGFIQSIISDRIPGFAKSNIKTKPTATSFLTPTSLFKAEISENVLDKRLPAVTKTIDKLVKELGPEKVQKAMSKLSGTITSNADLLKTDQYKALQAERLARKPLQQLHMDAGKQISAGALAGKMGNFAGGKLIDNIAAVNPNALVDIKGGWTRAGSGVVNRGLTASNAPKGFSSKGALADYQKGGVGKYSEAVKFGGGNLSNPEIKAAFTQYDQKMVALQQAAIKRGVKFFADTNADIDQFINKAVARGDIKDTKAARAELRKQYASYEDFDRKAAKVLTGRAAEVRNNAINTAKVVRYKATEADIKKAQDLVKNPKTPAAQKEQAKSFLQTYGNKAGVGRERSFGAGGRAVPAGVANNTQALDENTEQSKKATTATTKATKATNKVVSQSQRGSVASRIETKVNKSGQTYYVLDGKQISEDKAKTAFANQERARKAAETKARNRADRLAVATPIAQGGQQAGARGGMGMGGVGMLAMTAGMMAPMLPGKAGEVGGQLAGPLMALGMLSMLPPKIGIALAAIAALVGGIYLFKKAIEDATKEGQRFAEALTFSGKRMQQISEFTGTVSATELRQKRSTQRLTGQLESERYFGQSFLESDPGKAILEDINVMKRQGMSSEDAGRVIGRNLTQSIVQGVLDPGQALSIAAAIGESLGDYTIPAKISGTIVRLIGPSGENLAKDPIQVAFELQQETIESQKEFADASNAIIAENKRAVKETNTQWEDWGVGVGSGMAAIGALMSLTGVFAPLGAVLVAIGGVVGGVSAVAKGINESDEPTGYERFKENIELRNAAISQGLNALGQSQQQLDIIDNQYFTEKANLELAKDRATTEEEILEIQKKQDFLDSRRNEQRQQALSQTQQLVDNLTSYAKNLGTKEYSEGIRSALEAQYAESPDKAFVLDSFDKSSDYLELAAKDGDQAGVDFAVRIQAEFGAGNISWTAVDALINAAETGEDFETKFNTFINTAGSANASDVIALLNKIGVGSNQYGIFVEFFTNSEDLDKSINALARLSELETSFGLEVSLDTKDITEAETYLEELAGMDDVITKDIVINADTGILAAFAPYWDDVVGSADIVNKNVIVTFAALVAGGDRELVDWWRTSKGESLTMGPRGLIPRSYTEEELAQAAAARMGPGFTGIAPGDTGIDDNEIDSGSGAEPQIDSLLKKLRDLRLATIDMKKGWEGMQQVLESVFAGGSKGIDVFEGLSNQIRRMGVGENLIEMIIGMDPDEYNKRKGELFVFDKAGNIIQTTSKLEDMQSAFNAIAIGEYVNEQQRFIENTKNQISSISILTAYGMSLSEAYELVQDEALAAAIAMGATKAEIQEIIRITGLAQQQRQNMEKEQEKSRISESVRKTNEEFKNQVNILNQLSKARGQYSDAQIQAILGDPDLQKLFLNPSIDPRALQEALNNANKQANLELSIKKLTVGGQEEIFQTGLSAAMSAFSAKEQEIDIQFRATIADDESLVKSAEDQLAKIDFELDDYQAALQEIGWAEQKINDSYKDRFDALSKVSELNDQITASKARQLDLADALSRGDIAAAAKAAQEMRSQEQSNAIEMQRSMMETAQQTEIARLRSSGGLSRDQLEEKILQLEKERFGIEENTIEPAQERIRLEQIQRDLRVADLEVLGKTRDEWEAIGNRIDVAQANGWKFADAMQEALNIVETLVASLLNRPVEVEAPIPSGSGGGGNNQGSSALATVASTLPLPGEEKQPAVSNAQLQTLASKAMTGAQQVNALKTATPAARERIQATITATNYGAMMAARSLAMRKSSGGMIIPKRMSVGGSVKGYPMGGLIPYKSEGGFFKSLGSDTVPAMLTPGEFVVRRPAVKGFGKDNLEKINRGTYEGNSVYNYNLEVNVKSGSNPNEIANTVMRSIKQVEGRRIRGNNL